MSLHISGVGRRKSQQPKATIKIIKMKFLGVLFFFLGGVMVWEKEDLKNISYEA